jgi:Vps52 / Sac2 family
MTDAAVVAHPQMSAALQEFLAMDAGGDALEEGSGPCDDLDNFSLGAVDITTTDMTLAGVEEQIEQFADHEVLKAILDQGSVAQSALQAFFGTESSIRVHAHETHPAGLRQVQHQGIWAAIRSQAAACRAGIHPGLHYRERQLGQIARAGAPLVVLRFTSPSSCGDVRAMFRAVSEGDRMLGLLLTVSVYFGGYQITSCDQILATMEEMLGKFQNDLGNISSEIRSLQEQSQSMSVKLKNRKSTEEKASRDSSMSFLALGVCCGIWSGAVPK